MERIEPSIGSLDLRADAATIVKARSAARSRRLRHEAANWLVILALVGLMVAGSLYLGARSGLRLEGSELSAKAVVAGFALMFVAQFAGGVAAFRGGVFEGFMSFLVPGYLFMALRRTGSYWPIVGCWLLGAAVMVAGMALVR